MNHGYCDKQSVIFAMVFCAIGGTLLGAIDHVAGWAILAVPLFMTSCELVFGKQFTTLSSLREHCAREIDNTFPLAKLGYDAELDSNFKPTSITIKLEEA